MTTEVKQQSFAELFEKDTKKKHEPLIDAKGVTVCCHCHTELPSLVWYHNHKPYCQQCYRYRIERHEPRTKEKGDGDGIDKP